MAYDSNLNELIVSGGCAGGCFPLATDIWSLSNGNGVGSGTPTWTNRGGAPNTSFDNGQFGAVDSANHVLMIFGGQNGGGSGCSTSGSTETVNTSTFSVATLGTSGGPPGERYFPHGGYDPVSNRLIISNGSSCSNNDLWVLTNANGTGGTPTWTDILAQGGPNQPPVGAFPSTYSPELNTVFLIEQANTSLPPNVWELSNASGFDSHGNPATPVWSKTTPTNPPTSGSIGGPIAYDYASGRLVVQIGLSTSTQYWIISCTPPCSSPSVTTNPSNQTVTYGAASVSFTAAASGSPAPVPVQWQVSTNGGGSWSNISGATNTTLTISNPTVAMSGYQYRAVFTNSCGSATSTAATLTVTPKALDITANNQSKTYGTSFTFAGTEFTTGAGQLINGDSVTSVTLTSPGAAATATVGGSPYTITPSNAQGTGLGNYSITYHNGFFTVNPASLDITANNQSKTYGTVFTFAGTEFSTGAGQLKNGDSVTSVTLTSTGAPATAGVAGSPYTIVISAAVGTGLGNYTITYHNGSLTVNKANATVVVTPYSVTYDGQSHTATYTITGVNGETGAAVGTVTLNTTHLLAGTYNADSWSFAGTANYNNIAATTITDTINAKHITGNFTADNKVYDGNTSATVLTRTLNGVISPDNVTLTGGTATFADKNVGNGKTVTLTGATLSGSDAPNYILDSVATTTANITAKNLTISGAVANNKQYDGNTTATVDFSGASLVGVISPDVVTIDSSSYAATFADKNVGNGKAVTLSGVALGGAGAGNYTVSQPSGLTTNITPKNLTISGAVANNKVYDGGTSATVDFSSASLNGVVSPDVVTINSSSYTATFADKNVGNGKAVTVSGVSLSGAGASNYTVSQPSGLTANITPKNLTINGAVANNKVYDGGTTATVDFSSASLVGVISPDVVTINSSGYTATFADKNVGNGKAVTVSGVTLSGAGASNYTVSQPSGLTANITAKNLTISGAVANNKVYDGNNSATVDFTGASLVGVIAPDVVTINSSAYTANFNNKNVGNGKPVAVSGVSLSGADAGNYTVSQPSGLTANITAKNLTISGAVANNKTYDGSDSATVDFSGASLVGVVSPDVVTINSSAYTAHFDTKNVGNGKSVTVSGVTLSGADAGNYTTSQPSGLTANVTPAAISASIIGDPTKTYDGTTTATLTSANFSLTGVVSGESFTVTQASGTYNSKDVTTANTVTASLAAGDFTPGANTSASNYTLPTSASGPGHITKANATVTVTPYTVTYDAQSHTATYTVTGVDGETGATVGPWT